jgi:Xaa-Pro aminopeptidase
MSESAILGTSRGAKLIPLIAEHQLDAIAVSSYQAVSYLAGTNILTQVTLPDRLTFGVFSASGEPFLVVCDIEASMVRDQTDIPTLEQYVEFADDPTEVLAKSLVERGMAGARLGIEGRRLPGRSLDILRAALPNVELVMLDDEIEAVQSVKTAGEIDALKYAAQSTLDAVLTGIEQIDAGRSELEFAAAIGAKMYTAGGVPTFTFFSTGRRALGAHNEPVDRPLTEGELWRIDLGGRFHQVINSDLARTGVVGAPTAEQEDILQNLLACQMAGFRALGPGRPASGVFHAVAAEFAKRGMDFAMPHVGHGLGIALHEFPILQPANDTPLEVGMVVNVEPMYKMPDRGECYHVEDLAVVTEDGFELLTQPQTELLRIEA